MHRPDSASSLGSDSITALPPQPWDTTSRMNRARGVALSSYGIAVDRSLVPPENGRNLDDGGLLDIELREDGGVRVLIGRMTIDAPEPFGDGSGQVVLDGLAVAYARYVIDWAVSMSARTNWHGSWMLGLHADGLRGREVTMASHLELVQTPAAVAYGLVGRMTEALNTFQNFKSDLTLATSTDPDTV